MKLKAGHYYLSLALRLETGGEICLPALLKLFPKTSDYSFNKMFDDTDSEEKKVWLLTDASLSKRAKSSLSVMTSS